MLNKPFFLTLVQQLSGLQGTGVTWAHDRQSMVNPVDGAQITMTLADQKDNGWDEVRFDTNDKGVFVTEQVGQRDLIVSLRCEAYGAGVEAGDILERVKIRLQYRRVTDMLNANLLTVQEFNITRNLPTSYDARVVSVAVMDVFMGNVADVDLTAEGQGETWIETVNTNNEVHGIITDPGRPDIDV